MSSNYKVYKTNVEMKYVAELSTLLNIIKYFEGFSMKPGAS